ncbi:hypothetical protein [Bradyrhizobium sp.]|uniref:hypothetical protein n=1 Tax=Bradyrhizobium sp. TaxID=376 RepID=UPI0039E251EE
MSEQRLSNRQIVTLKQLAICCSQGAPATLTRDQREAMQPLWRRGLVEMWFRCVPDEGVQRTAFFRPSADGWALIRAILGSVREEIAA